MRARDYALDALRGLALLGMALSGLVPWPPNADGSGGLPGWMFHAQQFDTTVLGISWVDLVFPFFLFAMGAAIPITTEKIKSWTPATIGPLLKRTALLVLFSLAIGSLRPNILAAKPTAETLIAALLFFGLFVLAYLRTPWERVRRVEWIAWIIGCTGLLWGLATWKYDKGNPGFDFGRQDIIIMVLAQVSLTATLLWHLTRRQPLIRMLIVMAVMMLYLTKDNPGSSKDIWTFPGMPDSMLGKIYKGEFQKYLMIALPGTMLGDFLLIKPEGKPRNSQYVALCSLLAAGMVGVMVYLLYFRFVWAGIGAVVVVGTAGLYLLRNDIWHKAIWLWGFVFLMFGLFAEPHGGGIQKDSATLSYFFLTSGLAFWAYFALDSWYRLLNITKGGFLAGVGANPLLGYAAITNLVYPLVRLTGLYQKSGDWTLSQQTALAVGQTLFIGLVCWVASRCRIYLRA